MDLIRLWISGLVFCSVIGAVVLALTPSGGAEKAVKTIVSVFLLSSMIVPLAKGDFSLDTEIVEQPFFYGSDSLGEEISARLKKELTTSVENILSHNGIHVDSVSIDIITNGEEISVEKVTVVISKKKECAQAEEIIEKGLGIKADVVAGGVMN